MTHIKTSSGFEWDINENALDDMELLEDVIAIDSGDVLCLPKAIKKIVGEDGKNALYDHLRTEDGRVPTSEFGKEFADIIKALSDKKK